MTRPYRNLRRRDRELDAQQWAEWAKAMTLPEDDEAEESKDDEKEGEEKL